MTSAIRGRVFVLAAITINFVAFLMVRWAHGMHGMTRQIASIALAVDDRTGFVQALTHGD